MGSHLLDGFRNQASSFIKDNINLARLKLTNVTQTQLLTEEVTDGNTWPPDTCTMGLISRAAFDVDNYWSIVQVLRKRLRQFDWRNWRVSYKALILLEHLMTHRPKSVADEFHGDVDVVKEMRNFQFNWGLRVQKLSERVLTGKGSVSVPRTRARARVLTWGIPGYGGSFNRGPTGKVDDTGLGNASNFDVRKMQLRIQHQEPYRRIRG